MVVDRLPTQDLLGEQRARGQVLPLHARLQLVEYRIDNLVQGSRWGKTPFR